MTDEQKEKRILWISFGAGLVFAVLELIFAIYSRSQSALMDAAYDASELVFIALILFVTPLFYKPVTEKRPYGFFQIESIFLIIKGFMMISVTGSISASVVESAISGGNYVNGIEISIFQLVLGLASIAIYVLMKKLNKSVTSPMINIELLGWRVDIAYSLGMSGAFFLSTYLEKIPLSKIAPYFDQIVAVLIVLFILPETVKMLWSNVKDVFLFAPAKETIDDIKQLCMDKLIEYKFDAKFFDVTRTGRHLWVAIYFAIDDECLYVKQLQAASECINKIVSEKYENCTCELILIAKVTN